MLQALIHGTHDPEVLADLAKGQLRTKLPALREALQGRFGTHHTLLLGEMLARIDQIDEAVCRLSEEVARRLAPCSPPPALLKTIPGVGTRVAAVILAEIGTDLARFPTAGHLASWAGLCPGTGESAGKHVSGQTRKGSTWLRMALVERPRRRHGPRAPTWPPRTPGCRDDAGTSAPRSRWRTRSW